MLQSNQVLVGLVQLGNIEDKVNLHEVAIELNAAQDVYVFEVRDPLFNLPDPDRHEPGNPAAQPQYDANKLFSYLRAYRTPASDTEIQVGVIKHKIYYNMYSLISPTNDAIIVTLRVPQIDQILQKARKTFSQYVELEIGAQLLALWYRRCAKLSYAPEECGEPWHKARWNCLFDWYGLDPDNIGKLMAPQVCDQVKAMLAKVELPNRFIKPSLAIVKKATKTKWSVIISHLPDDPLFTLVCGALIGHLMSLSQQFILFSVLLTVLVVGVLFFRVIQMRSS